MKTILIATKNNHKVTEYKAMLEPIGYQVQSLYDFPDIPEIAETGTTLEANALIKAETLSRITNLDVIADDSGLFVDALDGAPGVYSARYAGEQATMTDNNQKLLDDLRDVSNRSAYFATVICCYNIGAEPTYVEGRLPGFIAHEYKGQNGFGYDPIFQLEDGRHLAELELADKNAISHRAVALYQLVAMLEGNNK